MGKFTIYTTLDGFTSKKCIVKSYSMLNEILIEWVNERTISLLEHKTESELRAGEELRKYFNEVESQVFFRIHWRCYFLDYYLPKYRVAIEIDGGYHKDRKETDNQRDRDFRDIGIRTIRIKSKDVMCGKFIDILKSKITPQSKQKKHTSKKRNKPQKEKSAYDKERDRCIKSGMKRLYEHDRRKNEAKWI